MWRHLAKSYQALFTLTDGDHSKLASLPSAHVVNTDFKIMHNGVPDSIVLILLFTQKLHNFIQIPN